MDRENASLLIITIVFIAVMGGGALFIVSGYFVSQSANSTVPTAPQTFGQTFTFPQQQFNPYEQFSQTISDMTSRIDEDPGDVEAYRKRGIAYEQLADLTSAMDDYNAALGIDPEDLKTLNVRAKLFLLLEDIDNAIKDYNAIIDSGKATVEVYGARASVRSNIGDYEGAVADYTSAMDSSDAQIYFLSSRAWANRNAGNFNDAINDYTKLIADFPDWAQGYQTRALIWHELYNYDKAIEDIELALKCLPGDSSILADYALILHEYGKLKQALDQANKAVDLQTIAQSNGSRIRARIKRDLGDYEGAYSDLDKALAFDRDATYLLNERAWLSWAKGDLTRAQVDFERIVFLEPSSFYRHLGLGVNQYLQGNFSQAAEKLGLAVTFQEYDIDYAQLYLWLSNARANNQDLADELLREFVTKRKPHLTDIDEDDWPGKLIAFLLSDLSSNDLLEIAQTDIPLQTAQRKCEACFYIGSFELIQGNNSEAAEYFKQSMQTKVTTFYEYHSSATELRALGELE